jgi:hypothetical protein
MSAYDMMNEKKRPVYPTLDEGTYAEDVERGIAEAEKKAAEIERQAKRDRDMALIGDMAHLVSQGAAMHGGAWKIGQTQNEGTKGNERLRTLREKNAAQTAAFAKERAALMEAKRKEQNAQKLAKYNAELEAYKSAQTQANADRDFAEKKRHNEETEKNYRAREQRLAAQGGSGGGSSVNRDVYLINDDGTKKVFRHADNANNIQAAYAELPSGFKAQKEVKLYDEDDMGKPVLRIDAEGVPVTKLVENAKPTLGEMRQAIENYNARELNKDVVEDWMPEEDEIIDYEP